MAKTTPRAWLVKSEPSVYSFDRFLSDERTVWDGVRNPEARANLRAMKVGEPVLFYHSNEGKEIVGLSEVAKTAYPDPASEAWSAVDLVAKSRFPRAVTLAALKADARFAEMALVTRSRLSVSAVTARELKAILALAGAAASRRA